MSVDPTLLDDLEWRGLIAHSTDLDALREALAGGSVRFYVGFDPTAPSLHMGNLVQILTARRLKRGRFRSTRALENAIRAYVAINNINPKPFVWTKTADRILQSVAEFCIRTSGSHH